MENNTEEKSMLTPKDGCIFCSIAYGKTNQTVCFETNDLVIFHDHLPKAHCRFGFHWPPFNSVHHLHMHILGPKQLMSFNLMFDPRFHIFRKVERVLDDLKKLKIERKK
ncbi:unnamed protein product [Schistosoma mattheei]|uniref:HIT domain-containing protein n=1 Tax=Schistosoma mattheei TaxID=31246 RepID=A0AA85BM59_9TREM|nr:unnamed protein product [Schistosoma mattheei]